MLRMLAGLAAGALAAASPAEAQVVLLAQGTLAGSSAGAGVDLSGLDYRLENGLPANILGGTGSALAWAGGNHFLAAPDRGPNATDYNAAVDDTVSFVSRFDTIDMVLTPAAPGAALPFTLTPELTATTLLWSPAPLAYGDGAGLGTRSDGTPLGAGAPPINTPTRHYFTGRSDNFGAGSSANPADARLDPEGLRVARDGRSVFVSDEYGPYLRQFDRATGALVKTFALPANLAIAKPSPHGKAEIANNPSGRVANKGMEGLAITPDGKTLVGMLQGPLAQDKADPESARMLRIVTVDIASGAAHEYGYPLTTGSGVSEIVAVNDHQFLVDERDNKGLGEGSAAKVKQLFLIDLAGAVDITALSGKAAAAKMLAKPAAPFLDLVALLAQAGIAATDIPAKIEGLSFGPDVAYRGQMLHTLYIANDNDFVADRTGPSRFYVIGFTDRDLPGFVPQHFTLSDDKK